MIERGKDIQLDNKGKDITYRNMTSTSKRGEAEIDGLEENEAKAYDTFKGNTMIQNAQLNEKKNEFRNFIDKYPDMRAFESVQRMEVLMDYYDKLIYAVGKELEYLKTLLVKRLDKPVIKEIIEKPLESPTPNILPETPIESVINKRLKQVVKKQKKQFEQISKKLGIAEPPKPTNPWAVHIKKTKKENPNLPFPEVIAKASATYKK